jgi:branched-chain amino acid transport system ATP-binding protein
VVRDVKKSFGGVNALNGISLALEEGVILGLIGPNGAGKTTLFDAISGFLIPDSGSVELYGEDVTALAPDERAKRGLQRSFQDARLFPALTVSENIAVALDRHVEVRSSTMAALRLPNVRRSEVKLERRVDRLIELTGLGDYRNKFVRELSTGSRRIVDLACVLAGDPRVVLLDEPSSGVAQRETEELGPLLLRLRYETGCSMLLIEHDMSLITSVSDELLALVLGRNVVRGPADEVINHPEVVESYLGTSQEVIQRSGR